ncbi:hypothetical protein ANO11243_075420 [Dothideomycetidae sp. 11243]|nr:hypothetical protein ANO11243_075420 [fungal sp. No.11243]
MPALELSSNWKRLQSELKKSSPASTNGTSSLKRKRPSTSTSTFQNKRKRMSSTTQTPAQAAPTTIFPSVATPLQPSEKNAGLIPSAKAGRYLALDCEMVHTAASPSTLARVSIVNYHLQLIYDTYVLPPDAVVDYRTPVSGIRPFDLRKGYARPAETVKKDIAALLKGRVLVGHALRNDFEALALQHPGCATRDTARAAAFRAMANGGAPALRELTRRVLGVDIQGGEHCSVVDARATMELYKREKKSMDDEVRRKYGRLVERVGDAVLKGKVDAMDDEEEEEDDSLNGKKDAVEDESAADEEELLDGETDGDQTSKVNGTEPTMTTTKKRRKKKRGHKSRTTRA